MASIDAIKKKRPRRTISLCRICLTYSPSMRELSQNLENFCEILTIKEILEKVMCCEIVITNKSPSQICSVCLSLLRISYEFKNQFEQTQKKLYGNLIDIKKECLEAEVKSLNEVELIVGKNNYNLDDLVIVEDEEKDPDYSQFLDNLGKTVTVEYLGKPSNADNPKSIKKDTENILAEDISDTQKLLDEISKISFENEVYETIIIQFVSDTEENSICHDEYIESSYRVVKKPKCPPLLSKKINSLIIEGDVNDEQFLQDGVQTKEDMRDNIICNPGTVENVTSKRKKKDAAAKMMDIEKYIIVQTDEEVHDGNGESLQTFDLSHENIVSKLDINEQNIITENKSPKENYEVTRQDLLNDSLETGNKTTKAVETHFCEQCSLSFDSRWIFKRHLLHVHGIKEGRAPKKSKSEKVPREIQMKRRIQRLKERFKKNPMLCQICGYVSKSSGGAKYHSLTHGEKMYKCDLCPKKFYTPSHLKNHSQFKHQRKMTKHLCSVCGENRNSSTALAYHMKLHTNDARKYSCPICDITFLMKSGLNTHIRRHLGDRRFPCSACDKSFFSTNERKKHMMIHTGERPHKCKYCERRFVTPFNQKIHMMTHTGPFCCKICFKGLVDEDMLKLHIKLKHCISSSAMEPSEDTTVTDGGERYDKYELLIQSPGNDPASILYNEVLNTDSSSSSEDEVQARGPMVPRPRVQIYIEDVVEHFSNEEFRENFRMNRTTFDHVLSLISRQISSDIVERGRRTISAKAQLLIALWYFGKSDCYRSICGRFNIGRGTALRTVRRVTDALFSLRPKICRWPTGEYLEEVLSGFTALGFPNTIGCIDGMHVRIPKPKNRGCSYMNRKGFPSIVLQGICDHEMKFTHCYAGEVGSSNDAKVLQRSEIWTYLNDEKFPNNTHLIGDKAYPCLPELITPYKNNGHLTDAQKNFNYLLSRTRVTIERSFGLLQNRFRCLKDLLGIHCLEWAPKYIIACCVLHNICIQQNDLIDFEFIPAEEENEDTKISGKRQTNRFGVQKRDELCRQLAETVQL